MSTTPVSLEKDNSDLEELLDRFIDEENVKIGEFNRALAKEEN